MAVPEAGPPEEGEAPPAQAEAAGDEQVGTAHHHALLLLLLNPVGACCMGTGMQTYLRQLGKRQGLVRGQGRIYDMVSPRPALACPGGCR